VLNIIKGQAGDDTIDNGVGNDTLNGGAAGGLEVDGRPVAGRLVPPPPAGTTEVTVRVTV